MVSLEDCFGSFGQSDLEMFLAELGDFTRPLRAGESESRRCYKLGKAYETIGIFYDAIRNYEKSIAGDMRYEPPYIAMIDLYERFGLHYSTRAMMAKYVGACVGDRYSPETITSKDEQYPSRTVSLYIPCFNAGRYIGRVIESVMGQSYPVCEIIVIDDGSTDDSVEVASKYAVKIIRHSGNKGLAAARNTAIGNARGELLASVDSDVVPDRYWLERLVLSFTDERVAGAGGRLVEKNTVAAVDRWRQAIMSQDHGDAILEDENLNGSNNVFRMDVLRKVGGYNEAFRTNYEDMDLCYRIKWEKNSAYTTRYIPDAICRHLRIDSLRSAVSTCYKWRKPVFEVRGAYDDIEKLKKKSLHDIEVIIQDICNQVYECRFEILYPSVLMCMKTILNDVHEMHILSPRRETWNTLRAVYIILIYLLNTSSRVSGTLLSYILEDLGDITPVLDVGCKSIDDTFTARVLDVVKTESDIGKILSGFNVGSFVYAGYLSDVFGKLSEFFNLEPTIFTMAETSARRVKREGKLSPYRNGPRVMLLNPPWQTKERKGVRAGSRWSFTAPRPAKGVIGYNPYPFFLGYLSSMLTEDGVNNIIVDGVAEDLDNSEFIERVAGFEPDIIVMETATASFVADSLWLIRIKERLPAVKAIWTGPHATAQGKDIIRKNPLVDFIIQGEYEQAAIKLIEALIKNEGFEHLKGLLYISHDGDIVDNGRAEPIENLDGLPWPERLAVPIYKYNDLFAGMLYPSLQVHASRGCPFGCIYCVWPQVLYGGKKYRVRAPEKVVDEVEVLAKEYGFRSIYFDDDTFNIGKERILKLCKEMVKRNLNMPWGAMARADASDYETLAAMKAAGLTSIKFGVESGVQELVDGAGKGLNLDRVREAVAWCGELGIKTHLTFTFGLPGETRETIQKTIDFAKELNPDSIQFSITTPFPGTEYYEMLERQGNLLTTEWEKFDGGVHTVIRTDSLSAEDLEEAVRRANWEFAGFKTLSALQRRQDGVLSCSD